MRTQDPNYDTAPTCQCNTVPRVRRGAQNHKKERPIVRSNSNLSPRRANTGMKQNRSTMFDRRNAILTRKGGGRGSRAADRDGSSILARLPSDSRTEQSRPLCRSPLAPFTREGGSLTPASIPLRSRAVFDVLCPDRWHNQGTQGKSPEKDRIGGKRGCFRAPRVVKLF